LNRSGGRQTAAFLQHIEACGSLPRSRYGGFVGDNDIEMARGSVQDADMDSGNQSALSTEKVSFSRLTRLPWFMSYLMITLIACPGCGHESKSNITSSPRIEMLAPVGTGMITNASGGDFISYSLYALTGSLRFDEEDFLLVFRNISAKGIGLADVTVDNFRLQDSKGKYVTLALHSLPRSIGYREATSLHLAVIDFTNASCPLALTFKATFAGVPVSMCITNIGIIEK